MQCGTIRKLKAMGLSPAAIFVYLALKDEADCHEDLRVMASREWIAELTGYSEKVIRKALLDLQKAGLIEIKVMVKKRAALISFLDRREGQPKGQPKGQPIYSKNRDESISEGQPKGQPKGQTGVTAVRRSLGVVHSSPGLESELHTPRQRAEVYMRRNGRPLQNPDKKFPGYSQALEHMTAAWAKKFGAAYRVTQGDRNELARECEARSPAELAGLWDTYLTRQDSYWTDKGFTITFFCRNVNTIVSKDRGHLRRAEAFEKKWLGGVKTERLKAQLEALAKPKQKTPEEPILPSSEEELRRLHESKVQAIGCKTRDCRYCETPVATAR